MLSTGQARSNHQTFKNKRAQYYIRLRDKFYNAYRAVVKGEYVDSDELISVSSTIECLPQFRSEVCRIPKKNNPNGLIQIMDKPGQDFWIIVNDSDAHSSATNLIEHSNLVPSLPTSDETEG